MKIAYYPGCTLKLQAKIFEDTALAVAKHLGIEMVEMQNWNCCGTVSSLANDNLMHHIAPLRVLTRALKNGNKKLVTLCAVCWNTLKQSNELIKNGPDASIKLEKINSFLSDEKDEQINYNGEVEVLHFLEILRDTRAGGGLEKISRNVQNPLNKKIAPYYGCLFTRPEKIAIDNKIEQPEIMSELISALGGEPIDFPYSVECCGSYQTVNRPEIVSQKIQQILDSAKEFGAEAVTVACPMCFYNLDKLQKGDTKIRILYFTEIIAEAFGLTGQNSEGGADTERESPSSHSTGKTLNRKNAERESR
ncbi:MAG: CoB--CoM heterodisulfide reductase iron-sulfur subunit B family protein [Elusimicrobiota bacterium]